MKHILVTGGSGFIGSHLCDQLLSRGYAVTALDNFVTGRKSNLRDALKSPHFLLIEHDICEPLDGVKMPLLEKHGLFGVFHFACPASPVDFEKIPMEILKVDSIGTMHTVGLALAHLARHLIASTSEIYGDPQTEEYWGNVNTIGPRACYDETKRFGEAYVSSAARKLGLNSAIVRIFNTYGPRMRPDDGRVVPEICIQALLGKKLTIHGDGKQTRSFCYVSDLVDGIIKLFESNVNVPVNIGNPVERSILDFSDAVQKITGKSLALEKLPARPDDPKRRCPDITRAKTLLGWSPKVDLAQGLKATLEHFQSELDSAGK